MDAGYSASKSSINEHTAQVSYHNFLLFFSLRKDWISQTHSKCMCIYVFEHLKTLAPYSQKNTMFSPRKRTVIAAVGAALALSQHAHDTLEIGTSSFPKLFDTIVISSSFMWLMLKMRTPTTILLTEILRSSVILWRYYRLKQLIDQYMKKVNFTLIKYNRMKLPSLWNKLCCLKQILV